MNNKLIINELERQNPWWNDTSVLAEDPLKPKREIFNSLWEKITGNELVIAISGLRRIGKTTIVKQVINDLINQGFERKRILYFSFEEAGLAKFPQLLENSILYQIKKYPKDKLYFFFDEIQYVNFWNAILKKYVDLNSRLKFIVTGSSSLFLKTQATESLAGRIIELRMHPLSYAEYLYLIKNIKIKSVPLFSPEPLLKNEEILADNFENYLAFGEFPYLSHLNQFTDQKQYLLDWVIGKIIENDLPKLRRIVHPAELKSLVNVLILGSGQMIELQNLATDMGINRKTILEYLNLLEKTNIVKTLFNRGSGFRTRNIRNRKIYSCSVNAVVCQTTSGLKTESFNLKIGQIVENFVFSYLSQQEGNLYFWRRREKEVDFILETPEALLPIEVKYKNEVKNQDLKNLVFFCRKFKLKRGLLITKNEKGKRILQGITIDFLPAYFLS